MKGGIDIFKTLLTNPGSTSSEVSIFEDENEIISARIVHPVSELRKYPTIPDQFPYRNAILKAQLKEWNIKKGDLAAVVGRSALGRRESGTYEVNDQMIADVKKFMSQRGGHAAGMGCLLAKEIAGESWFFPKPDTVGSEGPT